ncbi:hypothetical protein DAPPUDRAFT_231561 [Daphnia pulex]|uniref:Small ribosomal subunit protein mS31 n=2 Tax=Daphnia pulex TaxID=6669 RepID=E9HAX6_DAPPU|nr:hypothetical protein DAPPUDRAFT_231561 [Daphnia pulex]|eukprot:EFX71109.1 hypothetical protein DAPPUDRAFT_231561 [Daphnia pulex]
MATALQNTRMLLRRTLSVKKNEILARNICFTSTLKSNKDEGTLKKDDEAKEVAAKNAKQKEAKAKLNMLLEAMSKESQKAFPAESELALATPKFVKKNKPLKTKLISTKIDSEMLQAVENVSKTFSKENEELKKNLVAKLESITDESEVARLEPFKPDKQKTADLNSLLNTLKVDVKKPKKKAPESHLAALKIDNVYGADLSGIFRNANFKEESGTVSKLTTWEMLYQKELELLATQPPSNGFQQMILWTKQGKFWQFPIDNEQGLEEEAKVGFHEHVFLEPYLNPWCPRRGPVRHFMELVTVGLSKNPYLTVAQKKEHINWFRNFFDAQRSILIETGAIPDVPSKSPPSLSA